MEGLQVVVDDTKYLKQLYPRNIIQWNSGNNAISNRIVCSLDRQEMISHSFEWFNRNNI